MHSLPTIYVCPACDRLEAAYGVVDCPDCGTEMESADLSDVYGWA